MKESNIPKINKQEIQRAFNRAAATYDEAAVLQHEIGERLLLRLKLFKVSPKSILDLGAGTGHTTCQLQKVFPKAKVFGLDIAHDMLRHAQKRNGWFKKTRYVCGDFESIPIRDNSVDLVFSNLSFQWHQDLPLLFKECQRVLRPGGFLLFTTLGPDTLKELRASFMAVDNQPHVHPLLDMHDIGDQVLNYFQDPVMDMEMLTVTYKNVKKILKDLQAIGATNKIPSRQQSLTGKDKLAAMYKAYDEFKQEDGLYPVSYEVIYGHAFKAESGKLQQTLDDGSIAIPINTLQKELK